MTLAIFSSVGKRGSGDIITPTRKHVAHLSEKSSFDSVRNFFFSNFIVFFAFRILFEEKKVQCFF